MYLKFYNDNVYLQLLQYAETGLKQIETFINESIGSSNYIDLVELEKIYRNLFGKPNVEKLVDFEITRIHKLIYFKEVAFDRSNSYFHLKLIITSPELKWLDEIYGGVLSRVFKYYKALFSKIDNTFANNNLKQKELSQDLIDYALNEINSLLKIEKERKDINSERRRLKSQYLAKIPFEGLFHMTHASNIEGILKHGIFSHTIAREKKLMKTDISNPNINKRRSRLESIFNYKVHDYAPLYINPRNPMMAAKCKEGIRDEIVLIKVSPNILVNKSVIFTDGNAGEESSKFYNNIEDFNNLDWACLHEEYYFDHKDGRRVRCSEVLVFKHISIPYIEEMISTNEEILQNVLGLFPNHLGIKLNVDKTIFY